MNVKVKDLVKGREYRYTAGAEPVVVVYVRETFNGYIFSDGRKENELSIMSVKLFIEEI
jgi:hypothetical protein